MNLPIRLTWQSGIALVMATVCFTALPQDSCAQEVSKQGQLQPGLELNLLSRENKHPAIAYSSDGNQLFVVWDGLVNGSRRILLRERVSGQWLPPVVVDVNPAGNNSSPSIGIDAAGTPHVAWISTNAQNQRSAVYARRLSREPNSWYQQALPFPADANKISSCDFVNLQLDDANRPWIVWQYGYGSVYSIACSRFADDGTIVTDELTPGSTTHNLYPELFFQPDPTVYWYVAASDQFYLISSTFQPSAREWKLTTPQNLDALPAGNLPDLFNTGRGPLAGIWYDHFDGENGEGDSDRIYLGLQDPVSKGRGEVIDVAPGSSNHSVAAAGSEGLLVTTWISETYEGGTQVMVGTGNSPETIDGINVSGVDQASNENPKVAATSSEATVVWQKTEAGSGDSSIVLQSLPLP